jgi:IclR family KDG regulon transcriptional repressor
MSTAHRLVNGLKKHSLLAQDPETKKYRLGLAAVGLGYRALATFDIEPTLRPLMHKLREETGETILLTTPNDTRDRSVCIARVDGQYDLRIHLPLGRQVPLHAGASAEALLAYFPADEVDELIRRVGLPKVASRTITDPEALRERLALIRSQGYAVTKEETNDGSWGVAAPIMDSREQPVAALGVSAPLSRYSPAIERRYVELLLDTVQDAAALL